MDATFLDRAAACCPAWSTATVLLRDDAGRIVGYGWLGRDGAAEVRPDGAKLFSGQPARHHASGRTPEPDPQQG